MKTYVQNENRKQNMGRDKLSKEVVKKVTINIPLSDVENINFVSKLQGKTTSAFMREVLGYAVELEINKREIFVIDTTDNVLKKIKIDLRHFIQKFDDFVDFNMRENIGAVNQGRIYIDGDTEMPASFWSNPTDEFEDDNVYLYNLIGAVDDANMVFWSKQYIYESDILTENTEAFVTRDKKNDTKSSFKQGWGKPLPTAPAKLDEEMAIDKINIQKTDINSANSLRGANPRSRRRKSNKGSSDE